MLHYLQGTSSHGLHVQKFANLCLRAFCDVEWASCPDDRKSISGFCMFLGPNLVSWLAKK